MKCSRSLIYTVKLSDDEMVLLLNAIELALCSSLPGGSMSAGLHNLRAEIKAAREL